LFLIDAKAARILRTIDESVSPCDDFYQFACGKWIESTVIPEHKSSQSTFDELQDELNKKLRGFKLKMILYINIFILFHKNS
jgi:predicted metalloendopeptidase